MATISTAAADLLRRSQQSATQVTPPTERVAPKVYNEYKKVIEAAGGKWDTKSQSFLFSRDPRQQLTEALSQGVVVSTKKATQAFYTPATVIDAMICAAEQDEWLDFDVLEPSAGEGGIAEAFRALGAKVTCIELDQNSCAILRDKGFNPIEGDFLNQRPEEHSKYDFVVMNPPFSKGQDMLHVEHAFQFLHPGGSLLAIMSPAFLHGSDKKSVAFRSLLGKHGRVEQHFDAGAFKESGTNVRTVLVRLIATT